MLVESQLIIYCLYEQEVDICLLDGILSAN